MKALVTGSAGFIGRHMVRELSSRGWKVHGLDPAGNPMEHRSGLPEDSDHYHYHSWQTDFQHSYRAKNEAVDYFRSGVNTIFDLVVHCAYHVGGRAAIDGTNANFIKNVQLDSSLFDWAVRTKQRRVLYFSSSAVYPTFYQTKWYTEEYPSGHLQLRESDYEDMDLADGYYGKAKCIGETLAVSARRMGVPVTVVRPFSGYGEDQSLDYPFPSIIQRAKEGDLSVWGPSGQTRDWIHVSDVVRGALAVVESGTEEPVNLCTGVGTEMGQLAREISTSLHFKDCFTYGGSQDVTYDETKPTGVFYRVGDPTRMLQYYTPTVTLEEGIRRAVSAGVA